VTERRPNILTTILAKKAEEVRAARLERPVAGLMSDAKLAPAARGLARALRRPLGEPVRVLAEIKRASPSAGPIRPGADPVEIARDYAAGGAAALSVLTDRTFFDGDLGFLPRVRAAVELPLLRKDFVIDPYQIYEAAAAGADGVLLIVAALDASLLAELHACADECGLDTLVEVHDVREAELALKLDAQLIGVNHRDLRTFEIDMSLTGVIAKLVPPEVVLVAESGIRVAADVQLLGAVGAHAVLVGEQLMRAPSPGDALRTLRS